MNTTVLMDAIQNKNASVGIIGLGYVGLPLAMNFCKSGFSVLGFDVDEHKVEQLINGKSYINYILSEQISEVISSGRFQPTSNFEELKKADVIIICVPTPIKKNKEPDLRFIEATAKKVSGILKKGQLVILESTTYPGCSDLMLKPILEKSGLNSGSEFYLSYSPERVDPGNKEFNVSDIPKVIGGDGEEALSISSALYRQVFESVVPVSSMDTAEAAKLTENIFRSVNIALVNELKLIFSKMGIDVWEVIEAARTKPFGFMPFYPGPGLGGHCIPVDPFYLGWRASQFGMEAKFIELAGEINTAMPDKIVESVSHITRDLLEKDIGSARILLIGMAYKKNIDDVRESPSFPILERLESLGADVDFYDKHVAKIPITRDHANLAGRKSIRWNVEELSKYDLALICTDHDDVEYQEIVNNMSLVFDTRNVLERLGIKGGNIRKL